MLADGTVGELPEKTNDAGANIRMIHLEIDKVDNEH
jgi:hypothetical protein